MAKKDVLSLLFLALLVFAAYGNSLKNDFVWDDRVYLLESEAIHNWHLFAESFSDLSEGAARSEALDLSRPLMALSLFVDYKLFGENPFGYHLNNLILHLLNVLLVFFVARSITSKHLTALISAAFFALHPIHTEAINPVTFREDLLASLFYLSSFLAYLVGLKQYGRSRWASWGLSTLCLLAALLSKEMAVTLPVVILSFHWLVSSKNKDEGLFEKSFVNLMVVMGLVTAVYLGFIYSVYSGLPESLSSGYKNQPPFSGLLTFPLIFFYYLKLLFLPVPLLADYDFPLTTSPGSPLFFVPLVLMVALIGLIRFVRKEQRFLIVWFFLTFLPVASIVPTFNIIAERFLYIPSVSFILFFSIFIGSATEQVSSSKRNFSLTLLILVLSFFLLLTVSRNSLWKNDYTLWKDVLKYNELSFLAHNNLGNWYRKRGDLDDAFAAYRKAISLWRGNAKVHYNLGLVYFDRRQFDDALNSFLIARRIEPQNVVYAVNVGGLYGMMGDHNRAVGAFRDALRLEPENEFAKANLARAESALREAISIK